MLPNGMAKLGSSGGVKRVSGAWGVWSNHHLAHRSNARSWQIARYDAAFFAYRVATPRHFLRRSNSFSNG